MLEREVKILEIEYDAVLARLRDAAAVPVFSGDMVTRYMDFNDLRLRKKGARFRVRTFYPDASEPSTEFGIKWKLKNGGVKVCDEHMIPVPGDHGHAIKMMLSILGMKQQRKERKRRESYRLDDLRFDIDTPHGEPIPPYLEIEGISRARIDEGVLLIGRRPEDARAWSGTELRAHYGIR